MNEETKIRWEQGKDSWFMQKFCYWDGIWWQLKWWVYPIVIAVTLAIALPALMLR